MKRAVVALAGFFCLSSLVLLRSFGDTGASEPAEPPVFTSAHHVLDLLVIAEPATITLGDRHPVAWVFAMCRRAVAQNDECPADSRTFAPYGGIRLQLYPGDHLRMRLINRLPPAPADAMYAHGSDAMMNAMLAENPVNIHTHGLIVAPRKADATDPTYGDYVFVLGYPAGKLPRMVSPDETATDEPIQYDIEIPRDHPSGLYWFHPACARAEHQPALGGTFRHHHHRPCGRLCFRAGRVGAIPERYFILKDMQVMGNSAGCRSGGLRRFARLTICAHVAAQWLLPGAQHFRDGRRFSSTSGALSALRSGAGAHHLGSTGADYTGGLWYFTINGDVYPQLPAPSGSGELWRMLNAGASRTYDLVLRDDQTQRSDPVSNCLAERRCAGSSCREQ